MKIREILEKLSPELEYGERIMNYDIGNHVFDTFRKTGDFTYEYSNSKNPDIKLRIKDDFPFRVVLMNKMGDITYGTTWNGQKQIKWKSKYGKIL